MGDFAVSHVSELKGVFLWTDHMFKGLYIYKYPVFFCLADLHSGKLTWQWNITIINSQYIFKCMSVAEEWSHFSRW